ncbi:hypothetical protein JQN58_01545 [Aneurinibacillus sp. BA2021]|nr:hypothetical protein [Aneurinibacillus sp. BA2021]
MQIERRKTIREKDKEIHSLYARRYKDKESFLYLLFGKMRMEEIYMSKLIPKADGQKISYIDLGGLPEKMELSGGNFLFAKSEKKNLMLIFLTNFGLRFLVDSLPEESLKELKELCGVNKEKKKGLGKPRRLTTLGRHSKTKATRELEEMNEKVLRRIQARRDGLE